MKVLLIDADSTIPNLALMKLSTFHKSQGHSVTLKRLELPYYPDQPKKHQVIQTEFYNKVYCSVIFENNLKFIHAPNTHFGGTGVNLTTDLPDEIENLRPDYSIYPENDMAHEFISRGCIRNCKFCKVPRKEGGIKQVNTLQQILSAGFKKINFLDNNLLALPNHESILQEMIDSKVKCRFNGLDLRLITKTNSELLSKVNHFGKVLWALDDVNLIALTEKKLKLCEWRKEDQFRFLVYVHPNMKIQEDVVKRIEFLRTQRCLPYIMRDISCWKSPHRNFYIDYAAYCNQPNFFKKMDFKTFLRKRTDNQYRRAMSLKVYETM